MATIFPIQNIETGCKKCGELTEFDFTYAYQPIVNIRKREIFGYEALVRDRDTKMAKTVLDKVNDDNRYAFDQACRTKAISMAHQLGLDKVLSINFLPNAVYEPRHCIQSTLRVAEYTGFPIEKIMFEVTESEQVLDVEHMRNIFESYQKTGFITALDDFGAGYAGLNLLASFQPNIIKIDIDLVRDIHLLKVKQIIVSSMLEMANKLNIIVLAEGIESIEEARYLEGIGIELMQGYFFAKPGYECLPEVDFSILD